MSARERASHSSSSARSFDSRRSARTSSRISCTSSRSSVNTALSVRTIRRDAPQKRHVTNWGLPPIASDAPHPLHATFEVSTVLST